MASPQAQDLPIPREFPAHESQMQCARRELGVLRPAPAGFYHRLRIVGSIVVLVHGGSLPADHACGQGDDAYRSGSAGGAPGEVLPSASGINLHRRSYCTKGHYHFGDRGATIRLPTDCRYCWRQAREDIVFCGTMEVPLKNRNQRRLASVRGELLRPQPPDRTPCAAGRHLNKPPERLPAGQNGS